MKTIYVKVNELGGTESTSAFQFDSDVESLAFIRLLKKSPSTAEIHVTGQFGDGKRLKCVFNRQQEIQAAIEQEAANAHSIELNSENF